jgi:hypothetical protein
VFTWQYTVISNAGIIAQPWGSHFSGFSLVHPPLVVARVLGPTVRVAWFPVCTLVARSMNYAESSGHWMVQVRHAVFKLGLVPPVQSRANGIPLALINTAAWLLMIWAAWSLIVWSRRYLMAARA